MKNKKIIEWIYFSNIIFLGSLSFMPFFLTCLGASPPFWYILFNNGISGAVLGKMLNVKMKYISRDDVFKEIIKIYHKHRNFDQKD